MLAPVWRPCVRIIVIPAGDISCTAVCRLSGHGEAVECQNV